MIFKEIKGKYNIDNIRDGAVFVSNLSTELDSATIVTPHINEINIEPYDMVTLDGSTYEYLVNSFDKEYVTYDKPYKYTYTINLMSLTRILDTILLPSMTVTNIGQNRTIGFYVNKIMNTYFKYDNVGINEINIPSDLENEICPEITLTEPTLREYLDTVFSAKGYICKLTYNNGFILSAFSLKKNNGEVPRQLIDSLQESNTANDYVSSLVSTISNAVSKEDITEYLELRSNEFDLTSKNAKLITSRNIYDVKKLSVKNTRLLINQIKDSNTDGIYFNVSTIDYYKEPFRSQTIAGLRLNDNLSIDISKFIVDSTVFNSLPLLKKGQYEYQDGLYKNNTIVWKRESNELDNLFFYESKKMPFNLNADDSISLFYAMGKSVLDNLDYYLDQMKYSTVENGITYYYYYTYSSKQNLTFAIYDGSSNKAYMPFSIAKGLHFDITYTPFVDIKVAYDKNTKYSHQVSMPNNTNDSSVDLDLFGKQSIATVNQLGNNELIMHAHSLINDNQQIQIGQVFDDYIVTNVEKSIHDDYVLYNAILSRYFVNKNLYISLNRTKRYTSLQNSNVVNRHDLTKRYITLSNERNNKYDEKEQYLYYLMTNKCKFGKIAFEGSGFHNAYWFIPLKTITGNSIVYTVDMLTNTYYSIVRGNEDGDLQLMRYLTYVDDNGEAFNFEIELYDDLDWEIKRANEIYNVLPESDIMVTRGKNLIATQSYDILKDSREAIKLSLEFIFKGNDNIYIGGKFTDVLSENTELYIYESNDPIIVTDKIPIQLCRDLGVYGGYDIFVDGMIRLHSDYPNYALVNADGEVIYIINNCASDYISFKLD